MTNYVLLFICIFVLTIGQILYKYSSATIEWSLSIKTLVQIFSNWTVLLALSVYFLGSFLWIYLLKRMPLSVAYPVMSLTYVAVMIVSATVFKEPVGINKIFGTLLILAGVAVMFR